MFEEDSKDPLTLVSVLHWKGLSDCNVKQRKFCKQRVYLTDIDFFKWAVFYGVKNFKQAELSLKHCGKM